MILYGALFGALILGVGGRAAMRVITTMNGDPGILTPSGTLTIVLAGAASGLGGALIFLAAGAIAHRVAPDRQWIRHLIFGGCLILLMLRGLKPVEPVRLALFTPLVVGFALALEIAARRWQRRAIAALLLIAAIGCTPTTSELPPDLEKKLAGEGIVRRAPDLTFRYTTDPGGRDARWEERRASIIVTKQSLLIHKNDRVGLQITPRTRRAVAVERTGARVRVRSGRGRSEEVWSFEAPDDPIGWATDIRAVIGGGRNTSRR